MFKYRHFWKECSSPSEKSLFLKHFLKQYIICTVGDILNFLWVFLCLIT